MKGSDAIMLAIAGLGGYYLISKQQITTPSGGGGSSYFSFPGLGGGGGGGLIPNISIGGGQGAPDITSLLKGFSPKTSDFSDAIDTITKALKSAKDANEAAQTALKGASAAKAETESALTRAKDFFTEGIDTFSKLIHPEAPTATIPNNPNTPKPPAEVTIRPGEPTQTGPVYDWQSNLLTSLKEAIGVGARQEAGAFLAGEHIIRPLPFADALEKLGEALLPKIAPKAAGLGAKIGTRAIPIVGWGLLGVDVGADILRLFGVDMPEWLGLSPIASIFDPNGNMLESWVAQHSQGATAQTGKPIPYQLADKEAAKGYSPEAPSAVRGDTQVVIQPYKGGYSYSAGYEYSEGKDVPYADIPPQPPPSQPARPVGFTTPGGAQWTGADWI